MNEIERLKLKLQQERAKNKELEKSIRERKREILSKVKQLEEEIKDIMQVDKER